MNQSSGWTGWVNHSMIQRSIYKDSFLNESDIWMNWLSESFNDSTVHL